MGQYFSPRKRLHQISNFAAIKKQLSIENNLLRFKPSEILKSYKTPSRIDIKVADLFRQIGGHSSRFVLFCSFWRLFTIKMIKSVKVFPFSFWKIITKKITWPSWAVHGIFFFLYFFLEQCVLTCYLLRNWNFN